MTDIQVSSVFVLVDGSIKGTVASVGYGLEFHVRDSSGTYLAYLEGARNKAYLAELLGPGAGSFVINANDSKATAANLAMENIVEVRWNGTTIGWWVIQRKRQVLVVGGPDQEEIEVSGLGLVGMLKKAVLYPHAWPALADPDSLGQPLIAAPSAGAAFFSMLNGDVDMPFKVSFDYLNDTTGTAWPLDVYLEFRAGQTMFDVVDSLHGLGYHVVAAPASRTLNAYVSAGSDVSDLVVFRQGLNILACTLETSADDMASVVLGEGQDIYARTSDFDWTTKRRQAFLPARNATNETQLAATNTEYLNKFSEPVEVIDLTVRQGSGYAYGVDYQLGDTVNVDIVDVLSADYRIYAAHLQEYDNNPYDVLVALTVNEVPTLYPQKVQAAVNAQSSVAAGAGRQLISQDTRANRPLVTFDWYVDGTVSAGDAQGPIYEVRTRMRLVDCVVTAGTAPGSTATFDIDYSVDEAATWTSLFDTKPTIAGSAQRSVDGVFSTTVLYPNTLLRFNIDGAGSSAAHDVTARLRARES